MRGWILLRQKVRIESAVWLSPVSLHPARHQRDQHVCKIAQHIGLLQKSSHRRHHRKLEESIFADFGNWEFLVPGTGSTLLCIVIIAGWITIKMFSIVTINFHFQKSSVSRDANTQVTKRLRTLLDVHLRLSISPPPIIRPEMTQNYIYLMA